MPVARISKTISRMVMTFLQNDGMLILSTCNNFVVMATNPEVIVTSVGKTSKFKDCKNFSFRNYFSLFF